MSDDESGPGDCPECGESWPGRFAAMLSKGSGCPACDPEAFGPDDDEDRPDRRPTAAERRAECDRDDDRRGAAATNAGP